MELRKLDLVVDVVAVLASLEEGLHIALVVIMWVPTVTLGVAIRVWGVLKKLEMSKWVSQTPSLKE
jgi:hypothetical protein